MTLKEAEEYFKEYGGNEYGMWHDDTGRYDEFKNLAISDETKARWRQETVENYIERLKNGDFVPMTSYGLTDTVSSLISRTFDIIRTMKINNYDNTSLLLDTISALEISDKREKIYVMETMAKHYGQAFRYRLGRKMDAVFEKISDFPITEEDKIVNTGWKTIPERYKYALNEYREQHIFMPKSRKKSK